jgi:hypothetical protein
MFVSKVDRPNACTGTQVENSARLEVGKVRRGDTKLVIKSQEEQIVLQVWKDQVSASLTVEERSILPNLSFSVSSFGI